MSTTIFGFVSSSRITVYLKETEEREYIVKIMYKDGAKVEILRTHSLSSAMREVAETIAQHTGGFTSWRKLT